MRLGRWRNALFTAFVSLLPGVASAQTAQRVHRVAHAVFIVEKSNPLTEVVRERLGERGFVHGRNLDLRHFSLYAEVAKTTRIEADRQLVAAVLAWRPDAILVGTPHATKLF